MIVLYIYRSLYGIRANMEKELNHDRRQQVFAGVFQHSMERTVCVCVCVCVCVYCFFFVSKGVNQFVSLDTKYY
jgi:hypothetical protein